MGRGVKNIFVQNHSADIVDEKKMLGKLPLITEQITD
jgi:hypothetical protein